VASTIVNGRVLMRDGRLVGIDPARIGARARKQAAAFWKRF
jgi:hypothetical protein